jgi:hypothetical protein
MTIVKFTGTVEAPPAQSCAMICNHNHASELKFILDAFEVEYAEVLSGTLGLTLVGGFTSLGLGAIASLRFLALSIEEGQLTDVEVLIGAPPVLTGSGGTFPMVTGGTFTMQLATYSAGSVVVRYDIATVLVPGDTAASAAQKINAAAALEGAPYPVATVVGGQLRLAGDLPGALEALIIVDELAELGFPDEATVLGEGSPVLVDRVFVASLGTADPRAGADVWVRGGTAVIHYLAAGS